MEKQLARLNFEAKATPEDLDRAKVACRGLYEALHRELRRSGTEVARVTHLRIVPEYDYDGIRGTHTFVFPPQPVMPKKIPFINDQRGKGGEFWVEGMSADFDPTQVEAQIRLLYEDDSTGNNIDFIVYDRLDAGSNIPPEVQAAIDTATSEVI